jgi:hypothetical protein
MGRRSNSKKLTKPGNNYPGNETKWPAQLRNLVQSYGADAVFSRGLETLGYPPTWIHTAPEASRVATALALNSERVGI